MKQETLEEALPKNSNGKYSRNEIEKIFELGAKWQQERSYSEEDMIESYLAGASRSYSKGFVEWFEQFKNK